LTFAAVGSHRKRLKLAIYVISAAILSLGILAVALNIPKVSALMEERASLQSYDVGAEGRFGGQMRAVDVVLTEPLGIGALEFGRLYENDVHQVYLSMFLNAGWVGGTLDIALVLLIIWLGMQQVVRNRGQDTVSAVLLASFIGMVAEGAVIDTDHWRHFFLVMAMILGMALAPPVSASTERRSVGATPA
jgi:O-antigen ligase